MGNRREAPGPAPVTLDPVWRWALQGDLKRALEVLGETDIEALPPEQQAQARSLLERFGPDGGRVPVQTPDPLLSAVLAVYQGYWRRVMLQELSRQQGETWLLGQLRAVLPGSPAQDLGEITELLKADLVQRGWHAILGVTQPYWELMAWTTEEVHLYPVVLPETRLEVKVVFLDGFASLGWAAFATCDRYYSGGWTTPDALFCVRRAYDIDSENFTVSYLAHEGQHFADNAAFPALEQPELEYRAKLAELVLARDTAHSLLRSFASRTGTDRSVPHHLANGWVAALMEQELGSGAWVGLPVEQINLAARALLQRNTGQLRAAGAETVTRSEPR